MGRALCGCSRSIIQRSSDCSRARWDWSCVVLAWRSSSTILQRRLRNGDVAQPSTTLTIVAVGLLSGAVRRALRGGGAASSDSRSECSWELLELELVVRRGCWGRLCWSGLRRLRLAVSRRKGLKLSLKRVLRRPAKGGDSERKIGAQTDWGCRRASTIGDDGSLAAAVNLDVTSLRRLEHLHSLTFVCDDEFKFFCDLLLEVLPTLPALKAMDVTVNRLTAEFLAQLHHLTELRFVDDYHRTPYPYEDPTLPSLSAFGLMADDMLQLLQGLHALTSLQTAPRNSGQVEGGRSSASY